MKLAGCALRAVALATMLSACATTPPLTMPPSLLPDLRGTWTGTWGGTPLTLVVLEQQQATSADGVSLGPWQLLGRELPSVSGVLTFTVRGQPVSMNVQGRLGDWNGRLTLVIEPTTVNGGQITLGLADQNRLTGTGTSRVSWEPQGPVELVRQAAGGPRGSIVERLREARHLRSLGAWNQL
jgi:hypothetical protein